MKTIEELFNAIDSALCSGKKLKELGPVLSAYDGDDWKEYEKYNPDHYSRNLVKKNDRMELLVLCWEVKQGCPVHDHPANGCLVRIMQSEVTENVYKIDTPPELLNHNMLPSGGIAYKEGNMILHEIFNHSEHRAASIHIYSPSNYKPNYFSK